MNTRRLLFTAVVIALGPGIAPTVRSQADHYTLTIKNDSRYDIYHMYVSPSENRKWGPDQLGQAVLKSGGSFALTGFTVGQYDVRFVDVDGDHCDLRNVKITDNTNWRLTTEWLVNCEFHATTRYDLKIDNDSRYDIYHIYVSRSENPKWGPDQLRQAVLSSGSSFTLTDLTPSSYDVRFVDVDGDHCDLRNMSITRDTSWRLTTGWLVNCEFHSK